MAKKNYMILDTETATVAFADAIASGNAEHRKNIGLLKPIVYNIGWQIWNQTDGAYGRKSYLIEEVYDNLDLFNTAYYADKRDLYEKQLADGEIKKVSWETAITEMMNDYKDCEAVTAYNAEFDFMKAIPYTNLYLKKREQGGDIWAKWIEGQKESCKWGMLSDKEKTAIDPMWKKTATRLPVGSTHMSNFVFRGYKIPVIDLWNGAVENWLKDNSAYKLFCLKNSFLGKGSVNFKSSAEVVYRYIINDPTFVESHMAFEDVEIETAILAKIKEVNANLQYGIIKNPFTKLKRTYTFVENSYPSKYPNNVHHQKLLAEQLVNLYDGHFDFCDPNMTGYVKGILTARNRLATICGKPTI